MKTISNAIQSWLLIVKKEKDGDLIAAWWALTSLMIAIMIGFGFLAWHCPIAALIIGIIIFLPGIFILYAKFSDMKIDAKIIELKDLVEKTKNNRHFY